jgi:hypothetical protein
MPDEGATTGDNTRRPRSVVCDATEAEQAMAWAKAHPSWSDDAPALVVVELEASRRR